MATDSEFLEASGRKRQPCIFSREVLSKLDPEQLDKVADALLDTKVSNAGLATVVGRWIKSPVDAQSVYRHRKGECACAR